MAKVRSDENGIFVINGGAICRPFSDKPTLLKAGDTAKARQRPQSQVHIVNGETWINVGESPEMCRALKRDYVSPNPIKSTDTYHP